MTTDPDQIREWAEERDAVPVSTHGGEGHGHTFARRNELEQDHEEHTWEEFSETFTTEELVFVYEDDRASEREGLGSFDLVERDAAFERADLGQTELEDRLRQGETVTTELVETQVIEREIVERDTIESEIIDTELADRHVVDSELLEREITDTEFVSADTIDVTTEETRLETIEEIERYTIESRVVDVDLQSDEHVERDDLETDVELETVQRSIVESDVVTADVAPDEVIEREVIESKRGEGDTVRTELIERRTRDEKISEQTHMTFILEETHTVDTDVIGSDILESELIALEEYETVLAGEHEAAEAGEATAHDDETASPPATGQGVDSAMDPDTNSSDSQPSVDPAVMHTPSADDQGKVVVDASGQEVGIASQVENETVYVDPEAGLADRLKARLGWGGDGSDEYPVEPAQIAEITDDEIIIRSE
ncbi:hypothetical protein G6M89_00790 [Natronolimnobius sp. AArcel1]|nr:hypothetical protein [Natronolimnobius sp. AArcel1]